MSDYYYKRMSQKCSKPANSIIYTNACFHSPESSRNILALKNSIFSTIYRSYLSENAKQNSRMDVIEEKAECMFRHTSVLKSPYSKNLKTLHSTKLP